MLSEIVVASPPVSPVMDVPCRMGPLGDDLDGVPKAGRGQLCHRQANALDRSSGGDSDDEGHSDYVPTDLDVSGSDAQPSDDDNELYPLDDPKENDVHEDDRDYSLAVSSSNHFDPFSEDEDDRSSTSPNPEAQGSFSTNPPKHLPFKEFQSMVRSIEEDGASALKLLHQPFHFDWATEKKIDLESANGLSWQVQHFWDYICIEAESSTPLSPDTGRLFDTVVFSLNQWSRPYNNNRYFISRQPSSIAYSMRFARSGPFDWFLMLYFPSTKKVTSTNPRPLPFHFFTQLFDYIVHLFETSPILFSHGINRHSVTLHNYSQHQWHLTLNHWNTFQSLLFESWRSYWDQKGPKLWNQVLPTIHLVDYGSNQGIDFPNIGSHPSNVRYITESFGFLCDIKNVRTISFAIASQVSVTQDRLGHEPTPIALLAHSQKVRAQYTMGQASMNLRTFPSHFCRLRVHGKARTSRFFIAISCRICRARFASIIRPPKRMR